MPYDEALPGLEDVAWGKAAQADGGWIAYVAEAEVVHVHDEAWEQVRNRYRREAMALRSIDGHAHFTRGDFASLLARNVVSDLRAALSHGALRRELGSILRFRYNQLAGTYRGFNGPSAVSAKLRERFYYPGGHGQAHHPHENAPDAIDYPALEAARRTSRATRARTAPARAGAGREAAPQAQRSGAQGRVDGRGGRIDRGRPPAGRPDADAPRLRAGPGQELPALRGRATALSPHAGRAGGAVRRSIEW